MHRVIRRISIVYFPKCRYFPYKKMPEAFRSTWAANIKKKWIALRLSIIRIILITKSSTTSNMLSKGETNLFQLPSPTVLCKQQMTWHFVYGRIDICLQCKWPKKMRRTATVNVVNNRYIYFSWIIIYLIKCSLRILKRKRNPFFVIRNGWIEYVQRDIMNRINFNS